MIFPKVLAVLGLSLSLTGAVQRDCSSFQDCEECTVLNFVRSDCEWCTTTGVCQNRDVSCDAADTKFFTNTATVITEGDDSIHFKPLVTEVKLKPLVPITVPLQVRQPKALDLEVLFVSDSSASMGDDFDNLIEVSEALGGILNNLCSGGADDGDCAAVSFSHFVDKIWTKPWTNPIKTFYVVRQGENFNEGQFTKDFATTFVKSVEQARNELGYSSGYEESTFEGLLNAINCAQWTENVRHLVILSTDTNGHLENEFQGPYSNPSDGGQGNKGMVLDKVGRYVTLRRNPNTCYFDKEKTYASRDELNEELRNKGNMYDAPSTGMIKDALINNNVIPIILTAAKKPYGQNFWKNFIDTGLNIGSPPYGALSDDSDNLEPLIKQAYESLSKKIQISLAASDLNILVKSFDSNFDVAADQLDQWFSVNVVLEWGVDQQDWKSIDGTIKLIAFGLSSVEINVKSFDCECQSVDTTNGNCYCGKCSCDAGFVGEDCLCRVEDANTECDAINGLVCSGVGICTCGECNCEGTGATGSACECPESCPIGVNPETGELEECSGQATSCDCGVCQCRPEYASSFDCSCADNGKYCPGQNGGVDEIDCGDRATCFETPGCGTGNAQCRCNPGFTGSTNSDLPPAEICPCTSCFPPCETGATCSCDGQCQCDDPLMSIESNCLCPIEGSGCLEDVDGNVCSGHGNCDITFPTCGVCECSQGYTNTDDSEDSAVQCDCPPSLCDENCNFPQGDCKCGTCECRPGFQGETCACSDENVTCPIWDTAYFEGDVPNMLPCGGEGRGYCQTSDSETCGQCICNDGFVSLNGGGDCGCQRQECPIVNGMNCTGNGDCNECGFCECAGDHIFEDCSCSPSEPENCPNDCSGHGYCDFNSTCGQCICDPLFEDADCSCPKNQCPLVGDVFCGENSFGNCTRCTSECLCKEGWIQPSPDKGCICEDKPCPVDAEGKTCSGNGECTLCGCECNEGFSGEDCSICFSEDNHTIIVPPGEYCNFDLVTVETNCTTPICPIVLCEDIEECQSCKDRSPICAWCGEGSKCVDSATGQKQCQADRLNESCTGETFNVAPVAAGAAAGIIFLALLAILLYKAITHFLDAREWADFEHERKKRATQFNQNPLGTQDTQTQSNALFLSDE